MSKKPAKKAGKPMGRPPKRGPKLENRIVFLVTPEKEAEYRQAANDAGAADFSDWIRRACDAAAANGLSGAST